MTGNSADTCDECARANVGPCPHVMSGSGAEKTQTDAEEALEKIGIYLSWVPPDHAAEARRAEHDLSAALEALRAGLAAAEQERDEALNRYHDFLLRDEQTWKERAEVAEARAAAADQAVEALKEIMDVRWLEDDGLTDRRERYVRGEVRSIARAALAGWAGSRQNGKT